MNTSIINALAYAPQPGDKRTFYIPTCHRISLYLSLPSEMPFVQYVSTPHLPITQWCASIQAATSISPSNNALGRCCNKQFTAGRICVFHYVLLLSDFKQVQYLSKNCFQLMPSVETERRLSTIMRDPLSSVRTYPPLSLPPMHRCR
jgi:hypothetical protein